MRGSCCVVCNFIIPFIQRQSNFTLHLHNDVLTLADGAVTHTLSL